MKASIKKYNKYLVQSKTLPIFAVPRNAKIFESKRHIFTTADKAGSLSDNSSSEVLRFLAEIGALPLVTYILLKFFRQCQETKTCSQWRIIVPLLHPYLKYRTSLIFLTKKSFFAFNPLHRTNCVISSRYFVQPCMSLQCDNQNGCMKTVFRNISEKCLQSQKGFASLLLPRAHYIVVSKNIFQKSCNKASLSCGTSLTGSEFLAELQGRLALSVLDITQNFIPCQELMKLAQAHHVRPMLRLTPVTALNPFYPFLTKKSFFAFNPLHRTNCVISSRYFVQPCMSLQCDNQNGCMKTVFRNISEKCLQSQKGFASLLLPKFHNTVKSLDFTGNHPYNEVGTFSGISSGDSGYETLASFRKSPASFVIYICQIFRPCQSLLKICSPTHKVRPLQRKSVRKSLNLSLIFLTKKSFFAFNPLHRTNCVISSRYFVQPCMSLQCDNQNGCMKTVFRNISEKCLQSQKFCVCLSLPRRLKSSSSKNIQITADKAGFLFGRFYFGGFGVLADFQKGPALLLYTISNFSFPKCQDAMKNLQPAHQVRPLQRKSVRKSLNLSLIFLTRKSSIVSNLFQRVRSAISLRCSVSFSVCS